jgi:sialate O-acetylesterase
MKKLIPSLILMLLSVGLQAQLRLPVIFDDHMVIQQNSTVPIWGWANALTDVEISVSWDTTKVKTKARNTAYWEANIKTPPAGGPHTITIKTPRESRVLTDVLSGEVWLCSGQSNMEWMMIQTADGRQDIQNANDPNIRLFNMPRVASDTRQMRSDGDWQVCTPESVRTFSAVAYYYAKKLQKELNVPIGLINSSWGGTPAEVWLPKEDVESDKTLLAAAIKQGDDRSWCPSRPGVAFNAMIAPLIPFKLAGAIWYQGESNVGSPNSYAALMEKLILSWRREFRNENMPFYFVQIAPWSGYGEIESGTLIREQQAKTLSVPHTGMVVVSDLVDNVKDIHPQYKKPVGERLANIALSEKYGKAGIAYKSPSYKSMKVDKSKVVLSFDDVLTGLTVKGKELTDFIIAGEDKKFYPAKAKIVGNTIEVTAKEVKNPVAVRFGWKNDSMPNLFSKEGLPVSSFRTDNWHIVD